jgi:hypothetical protein
VGGTESHDRPRVAEGRERPPNRRRVAEAAALVVAGGAIGAGLVAVFHDDADDSPEQPLSDPRVAHIQEVIVDAALELWAVIDACHGRNEVSVQESDAAVIVGVRTDDPPNGLMCADMVPIHFSNHWPIEQSSTSAPAVA